MFPVLLSLGPVRIYTMGIFMFLGGLLGLYYWWKMGRDEHWEEIELFDGYFLAILLFLVVGRIGYVIPHWEEMGTFYRIVAILAYPGMDYFWGILSSILFFHLFANSKAWDSWKVMDAISVSLSVVLLFGFMGVFFNGSGGGKEVAMGLVYPGLSGRRVPVELFGMFFALFSLGITSRIRKEFRFYSWYKGESSVAKDGLASLAFLGLWGLFFTIRSFMVTGYAIGILPVQLLLGIFMIVLAGVLVYKRVGRKLGKPEPLLISRNRQRIKIRGGK